MGEEEIGEEEMGEKEEGRVEESGERIIAGLLRGHSEKYIE